MSLDLLISKYLDGELSYEEDAMLRQIVKDNPSAKDEFDAAVLLNAAFREDAESIETPAHIVTQTEDIVLMRIMNAYQPPPIAPVVRNNRRFSFKPVYAFLLAVLMIGGVFNVYRISDFNQIATPGLAEESVPNLDAESNLIATQAPPIANIAKVTPKIAPKAIKPEASEKIALSSTSSIEKNESNAFTFVSESLEESPVIVIIPSQSEKNITTDLITSAEGNNHGTILLYDEVASKEIEVNIVGGKASMQLFNPYRGASFADPFASNSEVLLATFFSNDIANTKRKGNNSKAISSFSQSIAYSLNDRSSFGLELGSTEYGYDFSTFVKIDGTTGAVPSKIEGLNPIGSDDFSLYLPVTLNRQSQMFWVATFWDYSLLKNSRLSLQSRIGAGASGEGSILYGRLFGRLHLYRGIYLNAGAEIKGFDAKLTNTRDGFIGTGSLIYGLQIKF